MRAATLILLVATPVVAAQPPVTSATFTPDGKIILVGSQAGISLRTVPQLEQVASLPTQLAHVHDLRFSPDGDRLVAVGGSPAEAGEVEIYRWPDPELLHRQTIGEDVAYQLSWQSGGKSFATAGPDLDIKFFDRTAQPRSHVAGHSRDVKTIAMLPGGYFVSGSRDQTLRVWRQDDHELVRTLNNHTNAVHDIALRPGSPKPPYVLASASADKTVRFWWPVRGRLMRFAKLPSPALDICWTTDGEAVLAACQDGHFRIVDPNTVEVTRDVEVSDGWLYTVVASPDGTHAFVGGARGLMRLLELP